MADNPKSLASLADEYRIGDGKIEYYRKEVANCQGGLSCQRWSCIPIAELIGVIDALRAPTIAAPSPSNEPAVEWVMCAVRDAMREHNFVVERGSDLWNRLRRHIEAALKARKPEDDGAGR